LVDVAVEGGSVVVVVVVVVVRHGDGLFVECVCMWVFVGCSKLVLFKLILFDRSWMICFSTIQRCLWLYIDNWRHHHVHTCGLG
jgi:hypothetical protein